MPRDDPLRWAAATEGALHAEFRIGGVRIIHHHWVERVKSGWQHHGSSQKRAGI